VRCWYIEAILKMVHSSKRIIPEELSNHIPTVLEAVEKHPDALKGASEELRNNKDVVLHAVRAFGRSLEYASPELAADLDVVFAALKDPNGYAMQYVSKELRGDPDVVMAALEHDALALAFASLGLRNNAEVVKKALRTQAGYSWDCRWFWSVLRYASTELQADPDVVKEALRNNGIGLEFASEEITKDKELVLQATRWAGGDSYPYYQAHITVREAASYQEFRAASQSSLACSEESAPVVGVRLTPGSKTVETEPGEERLAEGFHCDVTMLMNGNQFDRFLPRPVGSSPLVLNDLASMLVRQLQQRYQIKSDPGTVFIVFPSSESDDVDCDDVTTTTPWDWNRPLTDFLKSSPSEGDTEQQ